MENLQTQVEELEQKRSKWLILNLIGFCVWDGSRIIQNYLMDNHPALTLITLLGWLIWVVSLVQILRLGKKISADRHVFQILNDELIELTRFKSWRAALVAVTITQGFIILLTSFVTEVSALFAAELTIFVAVLSSIGSFLYYNSQDGG